MILAKVVGTIVTSSRANGIQDDRYLLVESCDPNGERLGEVQVVLDLIGAAYGEMVMLCQGSSCRWTMATTDKPIDTLIAGIVDCIDATNTVTYRKE